MSHCLLHYTEHRLNFGIQGRQNQGHTLHSCTDQQACCNHLVEISFQHVILAESYSSNGLPEAWCKHGPKLLCLSVQQGMGMAFQMSNCFIHAFTWLIYKTFLALGIAFSISPQLNLSFCHLQYRNDVCYWNRIIIVVTCSTMPWLCVVLLID